MTTTTTAATKTRHRPTICTADVLAATGIRSRKQLEAAEADLQRHGLIRIDQRPNGDRVITLLDPATGQPLQFSKGGQ
jgi:hypothetical protein